MLLLTYYFDGGTLVGIAHVAITQCRIIVMVR